MNDASQTISVCFSGVCRKTYAMMNSFHAWMNAKIDVATRPGPSSGSKIRTNAPKRVAPSTIADSSSSFGTPSRNPRSVQTANGSTNVRYMTITPESLST